MDGPNVQYDAHAVENDRSRRSATRIVGGWKEMEAMGVSGRSVKCLAWISR